MWLRALALWLCIASPALAQDANALIEEGLALRREGRDGEAVERFRAAHAIDHGGRSLAQLALAEQAAGEWVNAERDLVAALAIDEPWIAERRSVLESALATIRTHVGRLHVVSSAPNGTVFVDGREVATLPMEPISFEVGAVTVEVRAPGFRTVERSATIRPGALSRLSVDLVPLSDERAERTEPEPLPIEAPAVARGPSAAWIVGLGGVGLTALALGATFAAIGVREVNVQHWNDDAQCDPYAPMGRMEACAGVWSAFRTAEDTAIALGIVSAALGVASAVSIGIGASSGPIALSIGPAYASLSISTR